MSFTLAADGASLDQHDGSRHASATGFATQDSRVLPRHKDHCLSTRRAICKAPFASPENALRGSAPSAPLFGVAGAQHRASRDRHGEGL